MFKNVILEKKIWDSSKLHFFKSLHNKYFYTITIDSKNDTSSICNPFSFQLQLVNGTKMFDTFLVTISSTPQLDSRLKLESPIDVVEHKSNMRELLLLLCCCRYMII